MLAASILSPQFIAGVIIVIVILCIIGSCIRIVPQAHAVIVERLGGYLTTWSVGVHIKMPFVDHVARNVILKEQVVDFDPQPRITFSPSLVMHLLRPLSTKKGAIQLRSGSLCSCFRSEAYEIPNSFAISCIVFTSVSINFCPIIKQPFAPSRAAFSLPFGTYIETKIAALNQLLSVPHYLQKLSHIGYNFALFKGFSAVLSVPIRWQILSHIKQVSISYL